MSGDAILMGWLLLVQKDEEDESYSCQVYLIMAAIVCNTPPTVAHSVMNQTQLPP